MRTNIQKTDQNLIILFNTVLLLLLYGSFGLQAQALEIGSTGNVGIGKAPTNYKLDVNGPLHIRGRFKSFNGGDIDFSIGNPSGQFGIVLNVNKTDNRSRFNIVNFKNEDEAKRYLSFGFDGKSKTLMMNTAGNVGIGSFSSGYKLNVEGALKAGPATFSGALTASSGTIGTVLIGQGGQGGSSHWTDFRHKDSPSYALSTSKGGQYTYLQIKPRSDNTESPGMIGFRVQKDNGDSPIEFVFNEFGHVGIGTTNPTNGKLVIAEGSEKSLSGDYLGVYTYQGSPYSKKFNDSGSGGSVDENRPSHAKYIKRIYSIYAANRIACSMVAIQSDARIKNIQGISDSQKDLQTLMAIEITDYTMIDSIEKGKEPNKKVIAQQLAEIYPQAVNNTITEVVPDIYQRAEMKEGWIELATDLQAGERVKLITEEKAEIYEVLAAEATRFQVKFESEKLESVPVFVYGREVNDFHAVDYDAVSMLNVSATQELARQVKQLQVEKQTQASLILELQKQVGSLEKQTESLDALKASVAQLQAMMRSGTTTPTAVSLVDK